MSFRLIVLGSVAGAMLIIAAVALTVWRYATADAPATDPVADRLFEDDAHGQAIIIELLEPILEKYELPAICAAVVSHQGLVAAGAVGLRKTDAQIPVTIDDLWHLGSNTKAMTAAVIGRLVEQGPLNWTTTLAQVFAELAPEMQEDLKDVTVLDVLSHRAGFEANLNWRLLSLTLPGTLAEQRYAVVKKAVTQKTAYRPRSDTLYSNLGYVVAGAIIEKVTGSSWEEQVRTLLFEPLEMHSIGFGGTGTPGKIDQPWGHHDNGKPAPFNGPSMDNPVLIAPAGCMHCTIADWAGFIIDQLRGAMGKPALLKPATYQTMHTAPFGDTYALGWLAVQRDWGGGTVLNHSGSNTMNYANVWIAPNRDFAVLVCTNQGGDNAFAATDEAVGILIDRFVNVPNEPDRIDGPAIH